jgi:hypothetical protein
MNVSNLTYPDELSQPNRDAVSVFKKEIWRNQEICNHCFQQIKSIGTKRRKRLGTSGRRFLADGQPIEVEFHDHYERSEHGAQEHTPWDELEGNRRFGTCFCLDCGAEASAVSHSVDLRTLTDQGKQIISYLNRQTRYWCVGSDFAEALTALKSIPDNTGYDTEILAVATAHSLESATPNVAATAATTSD